MQTQKELKFIGKGLLTIPKEWKILIGIHNTPHVHASIERNRIIIEKPPKPKETWDIKSIELNKLPEADQKLIKKGRKEYKLGKYEKFQSAEEFFSE